MIEKPQDTNEPDFSAFEDWYVGEPGTKWPAYYINTEPLTSEQKSIVKRNARLLLDRKKWASKVRLFEEKLDEIGDERKRKGILKKYSIHLDEHKFSKESKYDFSDYIFPCSVVFLDVQFGESDVSFFGATFSGDFFFTPKKTISRNIYLNRIVVDGNLNVSAAFEGMVTFRRLVVNGWAVIQSSKFKIVPDFREAKFGPPPDVAGMEMPRPKFQKGIWPLNIYSDGEDDKKYDVVKYRKLKSMAIAASDHEKSGEFFAYEMMAKRGGETTGKWELLFDSIYAGLSNYGQSYLRPVAWFVVLFLLYLLINLGIIFGRLGCMDSLIFAARLSVHNIIPFLSSLSTVVASPEKYISGIQITMNKLGGAEVNIGLLIALGTFQQLLGAILFFLLLLGLRNKFRLK